MKSFDLGDGRLGVEAPPGNLDHERVQCAVLELKFMGIFTLARMITWVIKWLP